MPNSDPKAIIVTLFITFEMHIEHIELVIPMDKYKILWALGTLHYMYIRLTRKRNIIHFIRIAWGPMQFYTVYSYK